MQFRPILLSLVTVCAAMTAFARGPEKPLLRPDGKPYPVQRTEAEWKKRLTPEQYKILRQSGTEPAFCGRFHDNKKPGVYFCVGCDTPLFTSNEKFISGTGWPSFFQPIKNDRVLYVRDTSYGMVRTEILCATCGGHLGHVFNDGPRPTGMRFCMNGLVLNFMELKAGKNGKISQEDVENAKWDPKKGKSN
jgi:peptide-methionine (R)-S-oxide reductase